LKVNDVLLLIHKYYAKGFIHEIIAPIHSTFPEMKATVLLSRTHAMFPHEFPLLSEKPLKGVIAHLTAEYKGNVHDRKVVVITSKSVHHLDYAPKFAADLKDDSRFKSLKGPNQWICYDFSPGRMKPTNYSVTFHAPEDKSKKHHSKNWVIEGSNDGKSWTELDRREDLNDPDIVTETLAVRQSLEVSMIRFRQIENDFLIIYGWEIFGSFSK
jgi:hypothetical protein